LSFSDEFCAAVSAIEKACFGKEDAFPRKDIPKILSKSNIVIAVYAKRSTQSEDTLHWWFRDRTPELRRGFRLVGYALARHAFGVGYLYSNAVLPEFQRRGIGSEMLQERINQLMKSGCTVIQAHTKLDNAASGALLAKHQFVPVQYVTDFYDDNMDAIFWSRSI
jgi:ribosomal protein S18 acetylase RimI-like enzyme